MASAKALAARNKERLADTRGLDPQLAVGHQHRTRRVEAAAGVVAGVAPHKEAPRGIYLTREENAHKLNRMRPEDHLIT
jgi:hypothetical protein